MEGSLVDIIGSVSTVTYSHKVTKEKIIMRSLPQIFTKVEAVDFEPFEERLDRITRNYQDKGSQVFADYKRIIAAKAKGWCLTSKQAWGIPAPVLSIVDREGFTSMAKELDIVATGSLFTCKEFIDHCRFLFLEHSHEIWWEWSVQALLPERLKPLAPFLAKDTSLVFDQQFVQGCSWLTLLPPSTATKSTEISKQRLLYPCTLAFEGKDQNETWLFSTSMTSLLTLDQPFFKRLVTHPLIPSQGPHDLKLSKHSKDSISLDDLIDGSVKSNSTRQYGNGVDIVRALVVSATATMDQTYVSIDRTYVQYRLRELNVVRKCYWRILGSLEGYRFVPNFDISSLSFINRFMYHQLIFYIINITSAYESMEFQKIYELYIDFLKSYVQDIFVDGTRNQITSFNTSLKAQESLYLYQKIFNDTLVTISTVLPFNAQRIYQQRTDGNIFHLKWPQIVSEHLKQAQEEFIPMNHLFKIRQEVDKQVEITQQRVNQSQLRKQTHVVFVVDELNSQILDLLSMMEDDAVDFLGVGRVSIESPGINSRRKNSTALNSFMYLDSQTSTSITNQIKEVAINVSVKLYPLSESQCPRCLQYNLPVPSDKVCSQCDTYIQELEGQAPLNRIQQQKE